MPLATSPSRIFIVTLPNMQYKNMRHSGGANGANGVISLTSTEIRILDILREKPDITTAELHDAANLSLRQTQRFLKKLSDAGIITRQGSRVSGNWIVHEIG